MLDVELARLGPEDEPDGLPGLLDAAAAVGARHVVGQLPDPDRSRAIDHFGRLCDLAGDVGLTVDLEFPSWMETGDLGTASAIVESRRSAQRRDTRGHLALPPLRLVAGGVGVCCRRSGSGSSSSATPRSPFHRPSTRVIHDARAARSLPGYGHLPLVEMIETLPMVPYALEVPNDVLRNELGTAEFARLVLTTARELLADCGLATLGHAT